MRRKRILEQRLAIALIFPALLIVFSLVIFPLIFSLYASFTSYNILKPNTFRFNYFQNYVKLFHDPVFWGAFINTIFFITVALLSELLLGLFTAIMIAKQRRMRKIISLLVLMPMMFAPALVGFQFKYLFNDQIGLINNFLWTIGIKKEIPWLIGPVLSRISVLIAEIWVSTPFMTAVLLAG
ncbi:MAG: sugar ABC transporter permease, partial [Deltaproteobacteria bacterium]|nr:sugar ABC transporter permease [Deltaproteobacteria bacterium]